jgi:oxygen-dependent protoporphyrinogen oxidase
MARQATHARNRLDPGYQPRRGEDETIGDFFAGRFGRPDLVDNVLSAMVHGIYGGDVWKLSVQSSLFSRAHTNYLLGTSPGSVFVNLEDLELMQELVKNKDVRAIAESSTFWGYIYFRNGFATLTDALAKELIQNERVTIRTNEPVEKLRCHQSRKIEVSEVSNLVLCVACSGVKLSLGRSPPRTRSLRFSRKSSPPYSVRPWPP